MGMARQAPRAVYTRRRYVADRAIEAFRERSGVNTAHLDNDAVGNLIDERVEHGLRVGKPFEQPDQRIVSMPELPVKLYAILRRDERDRDREAVVTVVSKGAFEEIRQRGGSGSFGAKLAAALAARSEPKIRPVPPAGVAKPHVPQQPEEPQELLLTYRETGGDLAMARVEKTDAPDMIRELVSQGEVIASSIEVWALIPIKVRQTVEVDGL